MRERASERLCVREGVCVRERTSRYAPAVLHENGFNLNDVLLYLKGEICCLGVDIARHSTKPTPKIAQNLPRR